MRIVAALVVAFLGAGMLVADKLSEGSGLLDDYGPPVLIIGLVAVGVELYLLPAIQRKRGGD